MSTWMFKLGYDQESYCYFTLESRFDLVMGIYISMFFRTVSSLETLNGKNQSDESWTWVLIMCLGGPNLAGRLDG